MTKDQFNKALAKMIKQARVRVVKTKKQVKYRTVVVREHLRRVPRKK